MNTRDTRIRYGSGSRQCEQQLLEDFAEHLCQNDSTERLARPLTIIVPSSSLRAHLSARLVSELGHLAGVRCATLFSFARELAPAANTTSSPDILSLLAARAARDEPALARALGELENGYRQVAGSVRDLVDAGMTEVTATAIEEAIYSDGNKGAGRMQLERAAAVIRTAARALSAAARSGIPLPNEEIVGARDRVQAGDCRAYGARLWIFGFADATGATADLIEVLVQHLDAVIYFDRPLDPDNGIEDLSTVFLRRLVERVGGTFESSPSNAPPSNGPPANGPPANGPPTKEGAAEQRTLEPSLPKEISWFRAPGREAELREVGRRIADRLDSGVEPEQIAIVAREMSSYSAAITRQLGRLGIPFSAAGAANTITPLNRRFAALAELLRAGEETTIERYLEAIDPAALEPATHDLQTALFGVGCYRLDQWAEFDLPQNGLTLLSKQGFSATTDGGIRVEKRRLELEPCAGAQRSARKLLELLHSWPLLTTLTEHCHRLIRIASDGLGWTDDSPSLTRLASLTLELAHAGAQIELERDEFLQLLRDSFDRGGPNSRIPIGGAGGGVQILDVTEARSRTWQLLFVVGLNHGSFPRTIREDVLFPDAVRSVLSREGHGALPDLPVKSRGFDEERYLFMQLLSSSPTVHLSWLQVDDDGNPQTVSPLVEPLAFSRLPFEPNERRQAPLVRSSYAPGASRENDLERRDAFELALLGALDGERERLSDLYHAALEELRPPEATPRDMPNGDPPAHSDRAHNDPLRRVALGRVAALAELDTAPGRDPARRSALGPYFGDVGRATRDDDPRRHNRLYITTLESVGRCPWQAFLSKILRLEPLPDPLAHPGEVGARAVGNLFHRTMDRICRSDGDASELAEALARPPAQVPWPTDAKVLSILTREAREVLRQDGYPLHNLERILVELTRPHLEIIRELDWPDGAPISTVGSELTGSIDFEQTGGTQALYFRVDRADHSLIQTILTDYKTSRRGPFDQVALAKTRRRKQLESVRNGSQLQTLAYVRAAGSGSRARYLFVGPEVSGPRQIEFASNDEPLQNAFDQAVTRALNAWEQGAFFPRLSEPVKNEEPATCDFCDLAQACRRGDSGARGRLRTALARSAVETEELEPAWNLWWRGQDPRDTFS